MYEHSRRQNKENLATTPLTEEENKKHWWMLRMYHAASWWTPHRIMGWSSISWYHVLLDLIIRIPADGIHNRRIQRSVLIQQNQCQHNARGRYNYGCCRRIWYWWKLCLLKNQSTCNAFNNWIYLSNIIDDTDEQYLRVHYNAGVTYTNNIGKLPG